MSHAERMAHLMVLLFGEMKPAQCAEIAMQLADLSEKEKTDYLSVHQMASQRISQAVGTASGHATVIGVGQTVFPAVQNFNGTLEGLAAAYRVDPRSAYHRTQHTTRTAYDKHIERILRENGPKKIADLDIDKICSDWLATGPSIGRALIGMLRIMVGYGAEVLNDTACARAAFQLSTRRLRRTHQLETLVAETEPVTESQSRDIIAAAHKAGRPSIALSQAFIFDCGLNQKDVIGEWVPATVPGDGDVHGDKKWTRGIRWEEIGPELVLRHPTIKGFEIIDLKEKPLVMQELKHLMPAMFTGEQALRELLPKTGAVVLRERTNLPWNATEFRRLWRTIADQAGVPKNVRNKVAADRLSDEDDDEDEEIVETRAVRRVRAMRVKTNKVASG